MEGGERSWLEVDRVIWLEGESGDDGRGRGRVEMMGEGGDDGRGIKVTRYRDL